MTMPRKVRDMIYGYRVRTEGRPGARLVYNEYSNMGLRSRSRTRAKKLQHPTQAKKLQHPTLEKGMQHPTLAKIKAEHYPRSYDTSLRLQERQVGQEAPRCCPNAKNGNTGDLDARSRGANRTSAYVSAHA